MKDYTKKVVRCGRGCGEKVVGVGESRCPECGHEQLQQLSRYAEKPELDVGPGQGVPEGAQGLAEALGESDADIKASESYRALNNATSLSDALDEGKEKWAELGQEQSSDENILEEPSAHDIADDEGPAAEPGIKEMDVDDFMD